MNYKATERMKLKEESEEKNMKTYEDGLNEAWELARKIVFLPPDSGETVEWLENTFGTVKPDVVLKNYSASEAIESCEKLKVGDEVVDKYGWKRVVISINDNITFMNSDGRFSEYCKKALSNFKKTGRHFPQIEEVLKQIKEN